jgi:hypothetical protein
MWFDYKRLLNAYSGGSGGNLLRRNSVRHGGAIA